MVGEDRPVNTAVRNIRKYVEIVWTLKAAFLLEPVENVKSVATKFCFMSTAGNEVDGKRRNPNFTEF